MEDVARRALLIGVGQAPGALGAFAPLDEAVDADLKAMRSALEESGYEVDTLTGAGGAAIGTGIHEAASRIPAGGTLLIYFTGHGVRLNGVDYLVPSDARAPRDGDWQQPYLDSLLRADISPSLRASAAGTVLWIMDACRNELSGTREAFGSHIVQGPPTGRFAVMAGCSAGERSGYTADGSFFTQGLAAALGSLSAPRTVEEVYAAAKAHAFKIARGQGLVQKAWLRCGTELDRETRDTEICQGRHMLEEWRAAVLDERLWKLATAGDASAKGVSHLQKCLLSLVDGCARTVHHAWKRLPDPWADDDFPVRLLQRNLVDLLPEGAELSLVEVTVLLAAPFLHEAAWAERLSQAAEIDPTWTRHDPDAGPLRRQLEQVWDHHAPAAEKLRSSWLADREDDTQAISLWLVHRWIAERFETDEQPVPAGSADVFARAVLGAHESEGARSDELSVALRGLAAAVTAHAPLDDVQDMAPLMVRLPGGRKPQRLRVRPLAALLRLAAALATDVRTLPEIIAEHLGVSDPVRPGAVVRAAQHSLRWTPDGDQLHMDMPCRHHALHAAMAELAERADQLASVAREGAEVLPRSEGDLLTAVPSRITARDLRPWQLQDGRAAYEVPLLRFHLAQTEVRDLLMGTQLYGDRALAVRELYQNAMDACRYRAMRGKYLRLKGRQTLDWSGEITIVQGEDERGRYVECRDNGVGMSKEQLMNTFTRAGSRFERSRTFQREQASWLRLDPSLQLYPNSRFGIGVFSYFMLADEMSIVTREVRPDGIPANHALRVDIPSSGSLFRIRRHDDSHDGDGLLAGGTRIRLYLRSGVAVSCADTLRKLVRVSEFRLRVDDGSSPAEHWEPGVLYEGRLRSTGHEAVPGVLWWVNGQGAILCDGIATNKKPYGYVLNLTGRHAGKLSVNRNELQEYDKSWAQHNWREGAGCLPKWPWLTMEWLWALEEQSLSTARVVWDVLRGKGIQVRSRTREWESHSLDAVGWFRPDRQVDKAIPAGERGITGNARPWRTAVLGRRYVPASESAPLSLAGFPVPGPGDAALCDEVGQDWRTAVYQAAGRNTTVAEVVRSMRRLRIIHPSVAPPPVREGALDWKPKPLDAWLAKALSGGLDAQKERKVVTAEPDDLGALVWASQLYRRPLGELARACARYAPMLRSPVPEAPGPHQDYVCTGKDLSLLYITDGEGRLRSTRRTQWSWDVWTVAREHSMDPRDVLKHLSRFRWLGWTPPAEPDVLAWTPDDIEVLGVLREYLVVEPGGRPVLPWAATIAVAAQGLAPERDEEEDPEDADDGEDWWETSLQEAEERLAGCAARLGFAYEKRFVSDDPRGTVVPSEEAADIVSLAHRRGIRVEHGLTVEDLALAQSYELSDEEFSAAVDELRAAGIPVPDNLDLIHQWNDLPTRTRYAFSGEDPSWDGNDFPVLPTAVVLFTASTELGEPLGATWEVAQREATRFGLSTPPLPGSLAAFTPGWQEMRALVTGGMTENDDEPSLYFEPLRWQPLTAGSLARYAQERNLTPARAYDRLAPLRDIGAMIPELTPDALAGLPGTVPTERDLIALEEGHRVSPVDTPLVPLDLVSMAGRLGEPVAGTWLRIEPYLPLQPAPRFSVTDLPDVTPLWQDLALLSVHLDGLLPALSGRVSAAHVSFAAGEVGESPAWVWQRLELYANLFGLELDERPHE
ncbi:caspase family protein [Streptomyces sp. NPDC046261]|uniref:HD domain-containing protein n=1 Tax=Streptomyces sp. NPDC046261 TaxID=3157200 RepID=UPI003402F159